MKATKKEIANNTNATGDNSFPRNWKFSCNILDHNFGNSFFDANVYGKDRNFDTVSLGEAKTKNEFINTIHTFLND